MPAYVTEPYSGVFQIQLPMPMSPNIINVYLIHRGAEWVLIDTGLDTEDSLTTFKKSLQDIGCRPTEITRILCTHHHPDHFGASDQLKRLSGAELLLHRKEMEYLLRALLRYSSSNYRAFFRTHAISMNETDGFFPLALQMLREAFSPALPDRFLIGDETLQCGDLTLQIISTPGHTPGHLCVYLPSDQLLFTGDHLLPSITPHVGVHPGSPENPLQDYLRSLKKLERFSVQLVLPAHGPCFKNVKERIDQILRHHEARQQAILDALAPHPLTAYDVAFKIFSQPLPPVHRELATFETIAHLELLLGEDKISKETNDGVIFYQLKR